MTTVDPVLIAEKIRNRYHSYLEASFHFREPRLRASFQQALQKSQLMQGPYLEAAPSFVRGECVSDLANSLFPPNRPPEQEFLNTLVRAPLYHHQSKAIRKVFGEGKNVMVATGTASGKTEAFLYPILLRLHQESLDGTLSEPGVRALVLYPMNALANDQRRRLGSICRDLEEAGAKFKFTFGQYTGETPEDESDHSYGRRGRERGEDRVPGELVYRKEMRENRPHILLTNYSMLEYLLIRPEDNLLFGDGRWQFIVLDEAHQYRGAKGIEMAMLMRRLKNRVRKSGRKDASFCCIATSATIASGEDQKQDVAKFATNLFGERFNEDDIIFGKRESIPPKGTFKLSADDYQALGAAVKNGNSAEIRSIVAKKGAQLSESASSIGELAAEIAAGESRALRLRQLLDESPRKLDEAADAIFPEVEKDKARELTGLVEILSTAKDPKSGPLLSARYHVFFRALEGAFFSHTPEGGAIALNRRVAAEGGGKPFEIALCRECGQHYFVGRNKAGRLEEAVRDPEAGFDVKFYMPIPDKSDEDKILNLCGKCGEISGDALNCEHNATILVRECDNRDKDERKDQLKKCAVCEYDGPDPVREVVHGADGPNAVIATAMHRHLPIKTRKILAFADGRQDAAFFACYLEDTHQKISDRCLILKALRREENNGGAISMSNMAHLLRGVCDDTGRFPENKDQDPDEKQREVWEMLYRELLTDERRISLEGVGLMRWNMRQPKQSAIPSILREPPWSLDESAARNLIFVVLDTLRTDRAVELWADRQILIPKWEDVTRFQKSPLSISTGYPRNQAYTRSWSGKQGWRVKLLARMLVIKGAPEDEAADIAERTLGEIHQAIRQWEESTDEEILPKTKDGNFRLNLRWWQASAVDEVFQCDSCGHLQAVNLGVCLRRGRHVCKGQIAEHKVKSSSKNDHYRSLYCDEEFPVRLRAEEHTAQIESEEARKRQRQFSEKGSIDVLSSSTTFEVGVDLGNLDAVFLRNVPPEPFNYAQRAGRAGRREGRPGLATTYCRRNPHDLYHFADPLARVIRGEIVPPQISVCNEKIIGRHMTATALSAFFRERENKTRFKKVSDFLSDMKALSASRDLHDFLNKHRPDMEDDLREIVPGEMRRALGLESKEWINRIVGEASRLVLATEEIEYDYKEALRIETESRDAIPRNYGMALWAEKRANTIKNENTLTFLSRKAVIPKYGFPVDVVELDTHRSDQSQKIQLQRDLSLAVAEYAPGVKVVANKKEWESAGIKKVAEKTWRIVSYRHCQEHNFFRLAAEGGEPEACEKCGRGKIRKFLVPQFGFVAKFGTKGPGRPNVRPLRLFTTRPYFSNFSGVPTMIKFRNIDLTEASPGKLVVLCQGRRGKGFYICKKCGAGFPSMKAPPHDTPSGKKCSGDLLRNLALGSDFETDVVRVDFPDLDVNIGNSNEFAYSLAFALVGGMAKVLGAPSGDLNATVYYGRGGIPPIILYDNVPGGAGLVARLKDKTILHAGLEAALKCVSDCECGEDESCYGCLRDYRNQFAHTYLRRGVVRDYLRKLLENKK